MINIEVSPVGSLLPADCSSHCCFAVLLVVLLLLHTVIGFPKSAPNPGHSPGDGVCCCCCYGVSWTALTKRSLSSSLTPWQGKLQEAGPVLQVSVVSVYPESWCTQFVVLTSPLFTPRPVSSVSLLINSSFWFHFFY